MPWKLNHRGGDNLLIDQHQPSIAQSTAVWPIISWSSIALFISGVTSSPLRYIHSRLPINTSYSLLDTAPTSPTTMSCAYQFKPHHQPNYMKISFLFLNKDQNKIKSLLIKLCNIFTNKNQSQVARTMPPSIFPVRNILWVTWPSYIDQSHSCNRILNGIILSQKVGQCHWQLIPTKVLISCTSMSYIYTLTEMIHKISSGNWKYKIISFDLRK